MTSTNAKKELTSLIKSSYHTYILLAISQNIDCHHCPCQNCPSHSHIITLIEHALESNNALFFVCVWMFWKTCALSDEVVDKKLSFPNDPPSFIDPIIREKCKGKYIIKTPLWAIQHSLSFDNLSKKSYSLELSNAEELSAAADGAFIICGFLNSHCNTESLSDQKMDQG